MLRQYKLRELNRNDQLHKEVFVLYSDCTDLFAQFVNIAIECGADKDKLEEWMKGDE